MALSTQHGNSVVLLNTDIVPGITAFSCKTGSEIRAEPRSNEVYPRFRSLVAQKPVATFSTSAIAAALDLAAATGLDIDSLAAGMIGYAQAGADGGTRLGATSHNKYTIADGLLVPRSLTCEHQGDASIDYEAVITYEPIASGRDHRCGAIHAGADDARIGGVNRHHEF
jgi:hypothetical protein